MKRISGSGPWSARVWFIPLTWLVTIAGVGEARGQIGTGACCLPDGSCVVVTRNHCLLTKAGSWVGTATCAPDSCNGACCLLDGTCASMTRASCDFAGGGFTFIGEQCANVVCTGTCCLTDKSCTQTGPVPCASFGGRHQGRGSTCEDCPVVMPTAYTYQGRLKHDGVPVSGQIEAIFSLWEHPTDADPGRQIGASQSVGPLELVNGLFDVELDFGQDALNGNARWLQIEIRDYNDPPEAFVTLLPRQPLTPVPYALQTRGIVTREDGRVGIGTKEPIGGLHVKEEPVTFGGTLTLEGSTHTYVSFFPRGAAAGRRGWVGYGGANTSHFTIENDAGGNINLVTAGDVVIPGKIDIGLQTISVGYLEGTLATLTCPAGTTVISGGCDCSQDSYIDASFPYNNGWFCLCHPLLIGNERVKAYAICARVR